MFQDISEAFQALSDPEKKKIYDQFGEDGLKGGGMPSSEGPSGGMRFSRGGGMPAGGFMNAEDLFAQFFGGARAGGMPGGMSFSFGGMGNDDDDHGPMGGFQNMFGGARQQQQQQQRAPQAEIIKRSLPCTLEELFTGFSKKLKITRQIQDASGQIKQDSNVLVVDGKPGWKAGTKLTFPGAGDQLLGRPAQDIVFEVEEKPHQLFKRDKDDLLVTHDIPLVDALCGADIHLHGIDGKPVKFRVSSVPFGYVHTLPGQGMPRKDGTRGELRVIFNVKFPHLTDQQKTTIKGVLPRH